jgi:hypothetical protein
MLWRMDDTRDWAVLVMVSLTSALWTYLLMRKRLDAPQIRSQEKAATVSQPRWYEHLMERRGSQLLHVEEWKNKNGVYRQDNGWFASSLDIS